MKSFFFFIFYTFHSFFKCEVNTKNWFSIIIVKCQIPHFVHGFFFLFFFFKISSSVQLQEWHFLYIADIKKNRKLKIQETTAKNISSCKLSVQDKVFLSINTQAETSKIKNTELWDSINKKSNDSTMFKYTSSIGKERTRSPFVSKVSSDMSVSSLMLFFLQCASVLIINYQRDLKLE